MLLTQEQFQEYHRISRATFFNRKRAGGIKEIKTGQGLYYYVLSDIKQFTEQEQKTFLEARTRSWKNQLCEAHTRYKQAGKATKDTTDIIDKIESEVKFYSNLFHMKIKGYDRRSLQIKVKTGKIDRKSREEKSPFRNKVLRERPQAFEKAMELVSTYFQDSLGSMQLAIDKAIDFAKRNEEYYEVAAVNIHTLKRHINKAAKQSGFKTIHQYMNHYNTFRKNLAYTKGAFTNDINFMDVFSLDDHKFDVAGTKVWNAEKGAFEQKLIYSWFMVEAKTMMPLSWMIKTSPFIDEDIVKMIMAGLKKYGKPSWKIICDNGLASAERVKSFCQKLDIILEPQQAYRPTQKATNERIFGIIKEETDTYQNDFVGSNHPVEGRHTNEKLSPEETEQLFSETIKRYETYLNGFFQDRPRKRGIAGIESLLDNSGRVSIRNLFDHYYKSYEPKPVTDVQLRHAYMKYDTVKTFEKFYIMFKKEIYLPTTDVSLVLNDKSYKYTIAYDPADLNSIDIYSCQDIMDRLTGERIEKGQYVCTLQSLANLDAGEKQRRVAQYNKKIHKNIKELAGSIRSRMTLDKNLANVVAGEEGLINVAKEQEKAVENIIKNAIPMDRIETELEGLKHGQEPVNIEDATSDESIDQLNNININE